jgi:hypothetical protein
MTAKRLENIGARFQPRRNYNAEEHLIVSFKNIIT